MRSTFRLRFLLLLLFAVVLIRTAWIGDDALITLRTVLNATHGFGLTFNVAERVQAFTHPLWLLLITLVYLLVGNIYYAVFTLAIATSLAVFWLVVRGAVTPLQACLGGGLLLFSRAFLDYATSGLENPLSNLLLVATVALFLREAIGARARLTGLWTLASLLYLSRPDNLLIVAPLLLFASWRARREGLLVAIAVGLTPAALWTMFSLLYYGFPFPNTAYAKLGNGIVTRELWKQGLIYLVDSLDRDALTLATIVVAALFAAARRSGPARLLMAGVGLHLIYVVSIGGDFMSGRFLVVPFLASTIVLVWLTEATTQDWIATAVVLGAIAAGSSEIALLSDSRFTATEISDKGTADERGFFFQRLSLIRATRDRFDEPDWPVDRGGPHLPQPVSVACGMMGGLGLDSGPYAHVLDTCALADPLLARLPAAWNPDWRIGHFARAIPEGYRETLEGTHNRIREHDPALAEYYDRLRFVIRSARLLSNDRLLEIVRLNRGAYDHLINRQFYRYEGQLAALADLAAVKADGTPIQAPGNRTIHRLLAVSCPAAKGRRYVDASLDPTSGYRISFVRKNQLLSTVDLHPVEGRPPGTLQGYTMDVPPRAREDGFDVVVITPIRNEGESAIGHLIVEGAAATDAELYRRVAQRDGTAPSPPM